MADAYHLLDLICSLDEKDAKRAMPRNKGQCILAEFNVPPHPIKAGLVSSFQKHLSFYLDMRLMLVGMERHCILAYFRPVRFDKNIRDYISSQVKHQTIIPLMQRYQVRRLIAYGNSITAGDENNNVLSG